MTPSDETRAGATALQNYDALSRLLHWVTALMVLGLWLIGLVIEDFPKGWLRNSVRSIHVVFGLALIAIVLIRLGWRFTGARHPYRPATDLMQRLAKHAHHALLVLLLLTLLAGVLDAWIRGIAVFDWWTFTSPAPGVRWIRKAVGGLHEWLANGLIALAAVHVLAALWHHWVLGDGVLQSMLRGRPKA